MKLLSYFVILIVALLPHKTDYQVHGRDPSIWTEPSNQLLLHHSTSNLNSDDVNFGIKSQRLSKDSYWRLFRSKLNPDISHNKNAILDYFKSFYLTSVIVLSLVAYNRVIHSKHVKHDSDPKEGKTDEVDFKNRILHYKVNDVVSDIEVSLYCMLPLRMMSRIWGKINSVKLPVHLRKAVLNTYIKSFGCNLSEALDQDLTHYNNLNEFFRRALRPGVRPIDPSNGVVSPADGTIIDFGKASNGRIEQVKGITYSLSKFFGPQTWNQRRVDNNFEYHKNLLINTQMKTELYSCVIYLSPGDYHRFHSPADWSVDFRRHFAGQLLSVRPAMVRGIPNLFAINERVVYCGQWQYGFFSMTAVGATNVGSIKAYFDKDLVTNEKHWKDGEYHDYKLDQSIDLKKGEAFGEFNLGSTIVLIFEAPIDSEFSIKNGVRVKYGESIAKI